ncbi:MAG TPA: nitroreductase/quinone reductase family protein [Candidatus Limnocylindrales bacterium]|nr:nitroreductase/quinone reductase family protein [Candidatus Limnocylindrales bacterium]
MPDYDSNAWEDNLIADLRANGGRPSSGPLKGQTLLVMMSTGAKSGLPRRSVLTYHRDGEDYVVAGSKGGAPTDPAWVSNVRANPRVTIEIAGVEHPATATIAEPAERDRLWRQHVAELPWFGDYERKTDRKIPMIRLRPDSAA